MKKTISALLLAGTFLTTANIGHAQGFGGLINKASDAVGSKKSSGSSGKSGGGSLGNLSNSDIISGLKEALNVGIKNAAGRLNVTNGFFGNALIKVLMPPEAKKMETALRQAGLGAQVDKAILSMNRAAEDAAGKAVPIFVNAITSMDIQDGLNILKGGNGAATAYLKQKTTTALTAAFRPVIQESLNKTGATAAWGDIFSLYNKLPAAMFGKVNTDLPGYVTERALSGLFVTVADEENKIRNNPAARVTDILSKVFGSL